MEPVQVQPVLLLSSSSHPDVGARDSPGRRLLRAERALRKPEPAAGGPRHRERAAGTGAPGPTPWAAYSLFTN